MTSLSARSITCEGLSLNSQDERQGDFPVSSCHQRLISLQSGDGGWGYRQGQNSAVEPTSLALLALSECRKHQVAQQRAIQFLFGVQRNGRFWPNVVGDKRGGWVTSLACLALTAAKGVTPEVSEGLQWLISSWPGEGGMWWRMRHRIFGQPHLVAQDYGLRGWSWTAGTSSWVEPTACALLALRHADGSRSFVNRVNNRRALGERMLCNRMCPGGGWNSGNPVVYGAVGQPRVGPTCWALFALTEFADHEAPKRAIDSSLCWLETAYPKIQGTISLVLAHLCLRMYGKPLKQLDGRLRESQEWLSDVPALAWFCMARHSSPRWLCASNPGSN